jgi:hypothetical protein
VGLSMGERRAVTKEMGKRYRKASKGEKGKMLDELSSLAGWSRRQARRALGRAARGAPPPPRRPAQRRSIYGADLQEPLVKVWATLGGLCGKRMAPFTAEVVSALERFKELDLTDRQREQIVAMSAATIDRRLAQERARLKVRGRSGTKPGTLLKGRIPIKTFSEWDDARPGFCQADLVAHEGGDSRGDFCQTLNLTDVATGWTEPGAVKNKAQVWVFDELKRIRTELPFDLLGLDSDNGSEFINAHLKRYCEAEGITFTRGRAYRKNDSCYIEQKNWSVIRQHTGYLRYDTDRELQVLRELYTHLRLLVNFFQPSSKLLDKTREGAKVVKRYDTARTPYQRVLASADVPLAAKRRLTRQYQTVNPAELRRQIGRCQDELLRLGRLKEGRRQAETRATAGTDWADGEARRRPPATPTGPGRKRGAGSPSEPRSTSTESSGSRRTRAATPSGEPRKASTILTGERR